MTKSLILRSLQAVLFTSPYSIEHKLAFSSEFLKHTQKIFSADPTIVTAPQNAPPNIPRIEIKSPDQSHIAQFSNNRIIFQFMDTTGAKLRLAQIFPHFSDALRQVMQCTMEYLNPRVVRLGFILRFIADLGFSANRFLSEEFLKNNPFSDAHELNLGILYKIQMDQYLINRWIRYKTLRAKNDPSIDYAMAVEIDINTLAEDMQDFTTSQIIVFYDNAFQHISSSIQNYPFFGEDFHPEE